MRISDAARSLQLALLERRKYLPVAALLLAFWPVWIWLATRMTRDPADAWGLLSLLTAAVLLWRNRTSAIGSEGRWTLPAVIVLIYAATYAFVPPLVRALIAMSAIAAVCSRFWFGRRMNLALWGLLLLAPPLIPSLNFFLGYPLRVLVGEATALLLQMNGFAAIREGSVLLWNGQRVSIDAPCSGIKMLWTGMYLSCALAGLRRLNAGHTVLLGAFAMLIAMMANVVRATALFYVEAGIVPQAQPAHALIGVVVFVLAAIAIAGAAAKLPVVAHAS
jgi:exosortase